MTNFSQRPREFDAGPSQLMGSEQKGIYCPPQTVSASGDGDKPPITTTSSGPRVTFKEETSPINNKTESNPTSSNDSGIDNQGTAPHNVNMNGGEGPSSSRFSTMPSVSRAGVHLPFLTHLSNPSEHTYCNQNHFSTPTDRSTPHSAGTNSSLRTFSFSECPSIPPLSMPQNAAGEMSFASLSRMYTLGGVGQGDATNPREGLMTRSAIIGECEDMSGRLCSQV